MNIHTSCQGTIQFNNLASRVTKYSKKATFNTFKVKIMNASAKSLQIVCPCSCCVIVCEL